MSAEGFTDLRRLKGQFSCGDEQESLDVIEFRVDAVESGDDE